MGNNKKDSSVANVGLRLHEEQRQTGAIPVIVRYWYVRDGSVELILFYVLLIVLVAYYSVLFCLFSMTGSFSG